MVRLRNSALIAMGMFLAFAPGTMVRAQTSGNPAAPGAIDENAKTADLIEEGIVILKRGKRLDRAISLFEETIRREPQNAKSLTYLGAAYAAQAFVMTRYIHDKRDFTTFQKSYQTFVADLQSAQQDQNHPLFGLIPPPPIEPKPSFVVGDGHSPPTEEALIERIQSLSVHSFQRLSEANELLKKLPKDKEFIALSDLQGWSALLLLMEPLRLSRQEYLEKNESGKELKPDEISAKAQSLLKTSLEKAYQTSPTSEQSRTTGDAFIIACNYPRFAEGSERFSPDADLLKRGLELTSAGADRSRDRASTWYWIAINQKSLHSEETIAALRKAAKSEANNPLYDYTYAAAVIGIKDKGEKYEDSAMQEAFSAVRNGNAKGALRPVTYIVSAPPPVRWAFVNYPLEEITMTVSLMLVYEKDCREKLKDGQTAVAFQQAKEWADCGLRFYRAAADESFTQTERERCFATGRLLLAGVGGLVAKARTTGIEPSYTRDLDFALVFISERAKRALREKGLL